MGKRLLAGWALSMFLAAAIASACGGDDKTTSDGGSDATLDSPAADVSNDTSPTEAGSDAPLDSGGALCACSVSPCACDVVAGTSLACALMVDGSVKCWGQRAGVHLDGGTAQPVASNVAATVAGVPKSHAIAGGSASVCTITDTNEVYCWGVNGQTELGYDTGGNDVFDPRPVPGLSNVVEISLGFESLCARHPDGTVECLGYAAQGAIGIGALDASLPPYKVSTAYPMLVATDAGLVPVTGASELGVASYATCVRFDASVLCTGVNSASGNLGNPAAPAQLLTLNPAYPALLGDAGTAALGTAWSNTQCALGPSGELRCWGFNPYQETAPSTAGNPVKTPYLWTGLPPIARVASGLGHTCAVDTQGAVWCWGYDSAGQCGSADASVTGVAPTQVTLPAKATEITVGGLTDEAYSCARLETGDVYCWGANASGCTLGRGDAGVGLASTPVPGPVKL